MKKILLAGKDTTSLIIVGGFIEDTKGLSSGKEMVIITDRNVDRLYGNRFGRVKKVVIQEGEDSKNLETVKEIYNCLLELGCERDIFIVGIGGGVVCDIAGFVASTYLRGLSFGFVATTLLAQVDAAVGGKNGVNLNGYKNLIGTIKQPEFVICDLSTLATLPDAEISNGLAEMVKHALIGNRALFEEMEKNGKGFFSSNRAHLEDLIYESIKIKADIVSKDEYEEGERRRLNFGHTFGHAIEVSEGIRHGEAIAIGMMVESRLSVKRGLLTVKEMMRMGSLLSSLGLPVTMKGRKESIMDAIIRDKKRYGDSIYTILLNGIGEAFVERVRIEEIEEIIDDMCES